MPAVYSLCGVLDDAELRRTLQSLALGKKRVLRKVPTSKEVNDDDVFHFNADFTDPRYQVHINSIQVKETVRVPNLTLGCGFLPIHFRPCAWRDPP